MSERWRDLIEEARASVGMHSGRMAYDALKYLAKRNEELEALNKQIHGFASSYSADRDRALSALRKKCEESAAKGATIEKLKAERRWIPTSERMPESGRRVIAFWKNALGDSRRSIASWAAKGTLDPGDDFEDCAEYDEEKDQYFCPEGWYEFQWEGDISFFINDEVTHWMPIPMSPDKQAAALKEENKKS